MNKAFYTFCCCTLCIACNLFWQTSLAAKTKVRHDKYFACTRSNDINVRNGPGEEYILTKKLQTSNMPVLIMHQVEEWVNVKLIDNSNGWIYLPLLKNNKSCKSLVIAGAILHHKPNKNSKKLYAFTKNEFVKVISCKYNLCRVRLSNKTSGWIEQQYIWGY